MPMKKQGHGAPEGYELFAFEPEEHDAWSRKWVILNTAATIAGAATGLVALVIAVIALTS